MSKNILLPLKDKSVFFAKFLELAIEGSDELTNKKSDLMLLLTKEVNIQVFIKPFNLFIKDAYS